jgi:hypothetical protein
VSQVLRALTPWDGERELAGVLAAEGHYQDAERLYRELIGNATKANAGSMLAGSRYDLACLSARQDATTRPSNT